MIPDEEEENKTYIALVSLIQYDCHARSHALGTSTLEVHSKLPRL